MSVPNLDVLNVFERRVIYYMNESVFGFIRYSGEKRIGEGEGGLPCVDKTCKQLLSQSLKVMNKSNIQQCQKS